ALGVRFTRTNGWPCPAQDARGVGFHNRLFHVAHDRSRGPGRGRPGTELRAVPTWIPGPREPEVTRVRRLRPGVGARRRRRCWGRVEPLGSRCATRNDAPATESIILIEQCYIDTPRGCFT